MKNSILVFILLFSLNGISLAYEECTTTRCKNGSSNTICKTYNKDNKSWTTQDTILEATFVGFAIVDWTQNLQLAREATYYVNRESNFMIENRPIKNYVNLYYATYILGHIAVSSWLDKPYRTIWQGIFIIIEVDNVRKNRQAGLGVNFNF